MTDKPSKSAKKREAQAIESLGQRLLALGDEQLAAMPMDDELRVVVLTTRNMRSHSALRRQRLFLAKTLRQRDVAGIEEALQLIDQQGTDERRLFHLAERWRDRLLDEGGTALAEFRTEYGADTDVLQRLLGQMRPTLPEAVRKRLRRDVFREVRKALAG